MMRIIYCHVCLIAILLSGSPFDVHRNGGSDGGSSSSRRRAGVAAVHGFSVRSVVTPPSTKIAIQTRSKIPDQTPEDVQRYLSSPANWPKIVTSSVGVTSPSPSSSKRPNDLNEPLQVGNVVDEIFGLPPILPLSVTWTCTKDTQSNVAARKGGGNAFTTDFGKGRQKKQAKTGSKTPSNDGRLEFYSPQGLEGIAEECEMIFDVRRCGGPSPATAEGTEVVLTMKYQPRSILAILAIPILTIDNTIALQWLLPASMRSERQPDLNQFRNLMGTFYGVAGLAHFFDCVFGPSRLLIMAGAPAFASLPLLGQLYALAWCFAGPLSFVTSRTKGGAGFADLGLILYGLVEVGGAALIAATTETKTTNQFVVDAATTAAAATQPLEILDSTSTIHAAASTFANFGSTISDPLINAIAVQAIVALAWFYSANKKQETVSNTD